MLRAWANLFRSNRSRTTPPRYASSFRPALEALEDRLTPSTLANAGFEAPGLARGTFAYQPGGASWSFYGSSGISNNASGFTSLNPNAPTGNQVAVLQQGGYFWQPVYLGPGTYNVSFLAAQRGGYGTQTFDVDVYSQAWGTVNLLHVTPAGTQYSPYQTASFTVTTAGTYWIEFFGTNLYGGDHTAFVDNVSLNVGV
jgi:hypothetical protein